MTCPHHQNGYCRVAKLTVSPGVCEACLRDGKEGKHLVRPSNPPMAKQSATPRLPQPGDVLHSLIAACGFKPKSGCGCAEFQLKMNTWGWWGCWKRRQEIVDWLCLKAAKQGVTLDNDTVLSLFKAALTQIARDKTKKMIP